MRAEDGAPQAVGMREFVGMGMIGCRRRDRHIITSYNFAGDIGKTLIPALTLPLAWRVQRDLAAPA